MNVFIVGAGFTKAVFPEAPLNRELLGVLTGTSGDSAGAALVDLYKTDDIEIALTRLDMDTLQGQPARVEEIRHLRLRLEEELAAYFSGFCVSEEFIKQRQWIGTFIDDCIAVGDVIIGVNYDCVLEGLLDLCGKWTPNGGYSSAIQHGLVCDQRWLSSPTVVLKIHGSANFVIAPYGDKPESNAIGFILSQNFFPWSAKYTNCGFGAGSGRPYVIAPSYVKIPTVELSCLMLEALAGARSARTLVIIGCSLRREDGFLGLLLTEFLRRSSWPGRRIIVVDPAAPTIRKGIEDYWGVNVSGQIVPIHGPLETCVEPLLENLERCGKQGRGFC